MFTSSFLLAVVGNWYPFACVSAAFVLVVTLLRFKVSTGKALTAGVLLIIVSLGASPKILWDYFARNWNAKPFGDTFAVATFDILLLLTMVTFLGAVMGRVRLSSRLPDALAGVFRSRRAAMIGIPAFMGLMPTPGGIMLSAPLVREMAREFDVPASKAALINYWFRHQWEYIFPLYPAIPMVAGLLNLAVPQIMLHNLYLVVTSLVFGIPFFLLGFPRKKLAAHGDRTALRHHLGTIEQALWPIGLTLVLCTLLKFKVGLSLTASSLLFCWMYGISAREVAAILRKCVQWDFMLAVFMAIFFGSVLESTGAVIKISQFLKDTGIPMTAVVFVLPFVVGASTGITSAMVAMSFPLLKEIIVPGGGPVHYELISLAFCGGLMGIFLSPIHICLTLTKEYFNVPFGSLYARLVPLAAVVTLVAFAVALAAR